MNELYKEIGIFDLLDSNKKFKIPEGINQIRIDVGLAGSAPNAAMWLEEHDDRFVFGIEPLELHWSHLEKIDFGDRFWGVRGAIAHVPRPTKQTFYHMEETGSSSFLKPTEEFAERNPNCIVGEETVNTFSLEFFLDHIPWDRFEYIEHIKTDCEGCDFEVVKSLGSYLQKIVFISSEVSMNCIGRFEGVDTDKYDAFGAHMISNHFMYESPIKGQEPKFRNTDLFNQNPDASCITTGLLNGKQLDNRTVGL